MKPLKDYLTERHADAYIESLTIDLKSLRQRDIDAVPDKDWELDFGIINQIYVPKTNIELWISMEDKHGKTWEINSFNSAYTKDGGYWCLLADGFATYQDAVDYIKTQLIDDLKYNRINLDFEYIDF